MPKHLKIFYPFGGWGLGVGDIFHFLQKHLANLPFLLLPQNIQDLSLVAACASPVGRRDISPRLLKHFSLLVLLHLPQSALYTIFQVIYVVCFLLKKNFNSLTPRKVWELQTTNIKKNSLKKIYFILLHNIFWLMLTICL